MPARTLVKAGFLNLDLAEAVRRVGWRFGKIGRGFGNVHKYVSHGAGRDPFLLIASQHVDKLTTPRGYNALLTVTSHSDERNAWVVEEFESGSGARYGVAPPEALVRQMQMYDLVFPAFLKSPGAAFAMWNVKW